MDEYKVSFNKNKDTWKFNMMMESGVKGKESVVMVKNLWLISSSVTTSGYGYQTAYVIDSCFSKALNKENIFY